ncbi:MAG: hypothetical protein HY814_11115 [Candidatus Riflebacteria bacterium]|nr:hypothetical protein [Candidatus Riflebacteria bacterium]
MPVREDETLRRALGEKESEFARLAPALVDLLHPAGAAMERPLRQCRRLDGMNVLVVDDEAHDGWLQVLGAIWPEVSFTGPPRLALTSEAIAAGRPWCPEIAARLRAPGCVGFDLILLDLRLCPESDPTDEPMGQRSRLDLSGLRYFYRLRDEVDPVVPVALFSATERALNLELMRRHGLSGVFVNGRSVLAADGAGEMGEDYRRLAAILEEAHARRHLRALWQAVCLVRGRLPEPERDLLHRAYLHLTRQLLPSEEQLFDCSPRDEAIVSSATALELLLERHGFKQKGLAERLDALQAAASSDIVPFGRLLNRLRNAVVHERRFPGHGTTAALLAVASLVACQALAALRDSACPLDLEMLLDCLQRATPPASASSPGGLEPAGLRTVAAALERARVELDEVPATARSTLRSVLRDWVDAAGLAGHPSRLRDREAEPDWKRRLCQVLTYEKPAGPPPARPHGPSAASRPLASETPRTSLGPVRHQGTVTAVLWDGPPGEGLPKGFEVRLASETQPAFLPVELTDEDFMQAFRVWGPEGILEWPVRCTDRGTDGHGRKVVGLR